MPRGGYDPAYEAVSGRKKAGRFPVRGNEGPALKTTEKRPARHKDTMILCGGISFSRAKEFFKLGRFSLLFAEKTGEKSTET